MYVFMMFQKLLITRILYAKATVYVMAASIFIPIYWDKELDYIWFKGITSFIQNLGFLTFELPEWISIYYLHDC